MEQKIIKNQLTIMSGLVILVGLCVEYYLFRRYVLINIIPAYPAGIDQANYLYASYSLYESILHEGFAVAWQKHPLIPTSFLFSIQAAIFFLFFGASRLTALSLNFLYFAALQLMAFYVIKIRIGRNSLGFLFIGLLLSTEIFLNYGDIVDFRIDFMALCIFGMWICAVLQSRIFLNRKWVLVSCALAILLISIRFIAAVYVAGILLSLLFYYACSWRFQLQRIKNIILFGVVVSIFIVPLLWMHHDILFSYYVYGHVLGPEKWERARQAGVTTGFLNLIFYPRVFIQLFLTFQTLMEILLILAFFLGFFWVSRKSPHSLRAKQCYQNEIIFLAVSVIIPGIILTADWSKSTIVPGIIVAPFLLLVVWCYWILFEKITFFVERNNRWFGYLVVALFFLSGIYHYLIEMLSIQPQSQSIKNIKTMIDDIGDYVVASGSKKTYAAEDKYTDFFAAIPAFYYETHQVLLNFTPAFGAYSQAVVGNQQEAFSALNKLNVFVTNTQQFVPNPIFLFEKSIAAFQFRLKEQALKQMVRLGNYTIYHSNYDVYVK